MEECIKVTRHKDEKRIGISQDLPNQITFWKHSIFFFTMIITRLELIILHKLYNFFHYWVNPNR